MACQLALHSRRPEDMGRLAPEGWREGVPATGAPAPDLPAPGGDIVLLKSGYAAHVAQARAFDLTGGHHAHGLLCRISSISQAVLAKAHARFASLAAPPEHRGSTLEPGRPVVSLMPFTRVDCQDFCVQVRPPKDAQPMPLPDAWGSVVRCSLREVSSGCLVHFSSACPMHSRHLASTPASSLIRCT